MFLPIDNAATRSLSLALIVLLAACGSDDDDAAGAVDPVVEIGSTDVDDPGEEVPAADDPDDVGSGDVGTGDVGSDAGSDDAGAGDAGLEDAGAGDAGSDAGSGDMGVGDDGAGDTGSDPGDGDAGMGDADTVDAGSDAGADGDTGSDTGTGDAGSGDAGSGDAGSGDAGSDDAGSGDAGSGDAGSDDAGSDGAGSDDAGSGDAGSGDAGAGDAGSGDDVPDDTGTGDDRPAVSIFPFDPAGGVPVIDGSFDEAWTAATFSDESGGNLLIDRLLIDRGAEAADGGVPYVWFAMHDFESLYLFVQFERTEPYTPFRDSERFFDDDAVNLFFDGDASRGERLEGTDGGDDRYFAIPLLAREGEARPEVLAPLVELAPVIPPSLEYGVCVCLGSVSGWELKIALSDLNIEVGRPFGFEVQLDQDLDGGERDARWGWSNPAPAMGGDFVPESPALSGTVTLREEPRP